MMLFTAIKVRTNAAKLEEKCSQCSVLYIACERALSCSRFHLRTMQRNVPSKSLQSCDVFLLAGGGGGYNFNFPLILPQTLLLVCLVFRRGKPGGWGKWGGIGSKMCKNLVPPVGTHVFPRSIQDRLLFNLSCLNCDQHLSYY